MMPNQTNCSECAHRTLRAFSKYAPCYCCNLYTHNPEHSVLFYPKQVNVIDRTHPIKLKGS